MLGDLSLREFADRLAAGSPTPGGGSAAALAGSLAASLVHMVCELTIGREAYRSHEPVLLPMRDESDRLRRELLALVDRDAAAFDRVMLALRLPKGTEREKAARAADLAGATLGATEVPLATAEACARILALTADLLPRANRNAVSDVGTAAWLAEAGLQGALMNVRINLGGLADPARKGVIGERAVSLAGEAETLRGRIRRGLESVGRDR